MKLYDYFYFTLILVSCEFQLFLFYLQNWSVYYLEGRPASTDAVNVAV